MAVPFIYLSDQCEITDTSEKLKSLPKILSGKDFFRAILDKSSAERLEEFCKSDVTLPPMSLTLTKDIFGCKEVTAVKCCSGGAYLYPAKDVLPDKENKTISVPLTVGSTPTDAYTFFRICTQLAERSSDSSISTVSSEGSLQMKALTASCYPFLLKTTAYLILALSTVSTGTISLSSASRGMYTELCISADTDIIPPFTGSCLDVSRLSPYLRGSRTHLSKALLSAQEIGFVLSASFSPNGHLSFTVSDASRLLPYTEFKFPTEDEAVSDILESFFELLLSVYKEQDKQ